MNANFGAVFLHGALVSENRGSLAEQIPYPSVKPMLLVDSENPEEIRRIIPLLWRDNDEDRT